MKKSQILSRLVATVLVTAMLASLLASCNFGGSLKLESFSVDRNSVKTEYFIGESIDFTNIKAYATYNDSSLNKTYTYSELTISYDDDITATTGTKTVKVSFNDPHLDTVQSANVIITVKEDPNAVKHESYYVDATDVKKSYIVGQTIDLTGVKVLEKMTDGTTHPVEDTSKITFSYSDDITASAGTKTVAVLYDGQSAGSFTITVNNPGITDSSLDMSGVKVEYNLGESVDLSGLKATVTYETGEVKTVTEFEFVTNLETLTGSVGDKTVVVNYNDPMSGNVQSASFTIKVDGITSYSMDTSGMTLTYFVDDVVSFEGIVVKAKYHYGKEVVIDFASLTFVHEDGITDTHGNKEVTVKVGNDTVGSFIVAVGDVIATPTVNTLGADLSYRIGEALAINTITVNISYNDGTADKAVSYADLTPVTDLVTVTATAGVKSISFKYYDDVIEADVIIKLDVTVYGITGYRIDASGMNGTYIAGDSVNYTGLKIYAIWGDGGEETEVDVAGVTFADKDITATAGTKLIPVKLSDEDIGTISITVEKNTIQSIMVDGFDPSCELNQTPDLADLTATITYKNGQVVTLPAAQLTVGGIDTSTTGKKSVVVTFTDPVNNETSSASFELTVIVKETVSQFEKPLSLQAFDNDNRTAGSLSYGQNGFAGEFAIGGKIYSIGDDNDFRFVPSFKVLRNNLPESLSAFYMNVTIEVLSGTSYSPLTKTSVAGSATKYRYYLGQTLIATVDTYYGRYDFTPEAVGKQVKISVLPSDEYYKLNDVNTLTLEAKIVDAYNVYSAYELSIIDNYNSAWDSFKNDKGMSGINAAGIVLHGDIRVTADDAPASYFLTTDKDITYRNSVSGATVTVPAGTRYLIDYTDIYSRYLNPNETFTIEGNFFTIDLTGFPLVASPAVFGLEGDEDDYGYDFSNATFIKLTADGTSSEDNYAKIGMSNIHLIGNASRDNYVDANDNLVSAGGLIFVKSGYGTHLTCDNMIGNSFFITYFSDITGILTANDVKCYDSYQNAIFLYENAKAYFNRSYFNGTGGPVVICQSPKDDSTNVYAKPTFIADASTVMETHVTGEEIWFKAVNAASIVSNIKALGAGLSAAGLGDFVDKNGKMNIQGLLMSNGANAEEAVTAIGVSGNLTVGDTSAIRLADNDLWSTISGLFEVNAALAVAPFLTVYDSTGTAHTVYFNGSSFSTLDGAEFGTALEHLAIAEAFKAADQVVLTQGGISVIFELYH